MESLSHLLATDREILNKSWAVVSKNMQSIAVDIFRMIFELAPDAKLMFAFMVNEYKEEKKSNEFAFHALRFIQVIESTMLHLDDPDSLDGLFLNLGRMHARHEEHLGFSSHYWSVFKECVLFHFRKAMKGEKRTSKKGTMTLQQIDSAIILWREVLRFIISRMKVGLCENGLIRKANKLQVALHLDELLPDFKIQKLEVQNGKRIPTGAHFETRQDVTQALRRCELSAVVPEYFLRRRSDDNSTSGESSPTVFTSKHS